MVKILGRLSNSAVRAVPMADGFAVNTTTVDGHGQALLACVVCSWYGYQVSSSVGGRIGDLFGSAGLDTLRLQAAGHVCPPEVRAAAQAARTARGAAQALVCAPGPQAAGAAREDTRQS